MRLHASTHQAFYETGHNQSHMAIHHKLILYPCQSRSGPVLVMIVTVPWNIGMLIPCLDPNGTQHPCAAVWSVKPAPWRCWVNTWRSSSTSLGMNEVPPNG